MSIQAIIVDDEYLAIRVLEEYARHTDQVEIVATFVRPEEALTYLQEHSVELLFLDIQMPGLDGFELLHALEQPPMVIFTTARHDYAVKAFELDVLDYLVKPISPPRFHQALGKAESHLAFHHYLSEKQAEVQYLQFRSDYQTIRIDCTDIDYIEGLGEYVKVYTDSKMHITLAALKDLIVSLPEHDFIRIHKSYIVARQNIASYNHQCVMLKSGKKLPLGRVYKKPFLQMLQKDL